MITSPLSGGGSCYLLLTLLSNRAFLRADPVLVAPGKAAPLHSIKETYDRFAFLTAPS